MTDRPWPPPPDLLSLEELLAGADVEGFLASGGHADEYETEAEALHAQIKGWTTAEITADRLLGVLEQIWTEAFTLGERELDNRRAKLRMLAEQIARFFGPEARPQVRGA